MSGLLKSRKFWLAVFAFVTGSVLLWVGFLAPEYLDVANKQVILLGTLVGILIGSIAYEDVGVAKATGESPAKQVWIDKADARQGEKAEARATDNPKDK